MTGHRFAVSLAALLLLLSPPAIAGPPWSLDAADWARPRTAEMVVALPAVRDAMHAWSQSVDSELVLRHPPGERGQLWAAELRDWLVVLGVPAEAVSLVPDRETEGRIDLSLRRKGGS